MVLVTICVITLSQSQLLSFFSSFIRHDLTKVLGSSVSDGNLDKLLSTYSTDLFWLGKHEFAFVRVFSWKSSAQTLQFSFPRHKYFVTVFFTRLVLLLISPVISIVVQIETLNPEACLAAHLRQAQRSVL